MGFNLGALGSIVGGIGGFMVGGPAGAAAGAGALGSIGSGIASLSAGSAARTASDPFGKYRGYYGGQLQDMWKDPSAIFSDPAFTAANDMSIKGAMRQMAAQGYLGSGNEAAGLTQLTQSNALGFYNQQMNLLAMLSGATSSPPNAYGAGMNATAGGIGQIGQGVGQVGSWMANMGSAAVPASIAGDLSIAPSLAGTIGLGGASADIMTGLTVL